MKKFLIKILLFIGFVVILIVVCGAIPDNAPVQNLNYSIFDKQSLLKEAGSPRLIIVGGSNVSFGFDSKKIQENLGINVINTGIHAGYGLKYIIDDITPYIKEGDIIVLSAEYDHFFGDVVWGGEGLMVALDLQPKNVFKLSFHQFQNLVPYVPRYVVRKIKNYLAYSVKSGAVSTSVVGISERKSYNQFGDLDAHWNLPNEKFENRPLDNEFNPYSIELISQFKKYVESKQGRLYVTYPTYNQSAYKIAEPAILKVEEEFLKNQFAVLGTPAQYSYHDSLYFNSSYHLNKRGIDMRTEMLCQDLKNYEFKGKLIKN